MKVQKKSAVKKVAPVAADAAPAKTTKAEKATVTDIKASKYKGVTTGMRVMEYQDSTFAANVKAMLTDEELAANWRKEFPEAVAFTVNHVTGARRDYNNGRHSKAYSRPEKQLDAVVLVDGKRVWAATVEKPKAEPKAAKPKADAKPAAAPAPTAKGTAKAVRRMPKAS